MTHGEFLRKMPDLIRHKSHGIQYLETKRYQGGVMACYRGDDKRASFGTYGKTWLEVYERLIASIHESTLLDWFRGI